MTEVTIRDNTLPAEDLTPLVNVKVKPSDIKKKYYEDKADAIIARRDAKSLDTLRKKAVARMRIVPVVQRVKKYPHVNVILGSMAELRKIDKAILEEQLKNPGIKVTRSGVCRRLLMKWVNYEVAI